MNKPTKRVIEHYDYHECAKYIAYKLGIKDLRDIAGKYSNRNQDAEYQDFWHFVLYFNESTSNGSYVYIPTCKDQKEPEYGGV